MLSFMFYDLTFLIVFSLAIALFLYIKRKKLAREGVLFLYKTSIGLKFIEQAGKKYPRLMKTASYVVVACGYLLMAASIYLLIQLITIFMKPEFVKIVKVPPIMPLIPYLPSLFKVDWLPPFYFTYWIIAIALVAIFHEGFHGIFARFYNIKIKSTGFGFLGPFLAFFVEQDEKQMNKAKPFSQMAVLAAGVFANVLLAILFLFLMMGFFSSAYSANGAIFNDYTYSAAPLSLALSNPIILNHTLAVDGINMTKIQIENKTYIVPDEFLKYYGDENAKLDNKTLVKLYQDMPAINAGLRGAIIEIDGAKINSRGDISKALIGKKPGEKIKITTRIEEINKTKYNKDYELALGSDYTNESRAVIGIATANPKALTGLKSFFYKIMSWFKDPNVNYEPKSEKYSELTIFFYTLLWWLFWINISVAVANMIPLAVFDGGRFFYLTILLITGKEKMAEQAFKFSTWIVLGIVILSMLLYFRGIF